ncbi:MAG TPA: type II toxin-antitoxin system PemK/MazF family toxin [Methylothermaceae bacterium]|nr:type II toxin-antitoxin system PemK/MazF family toxin [Methylothermaceae bacterium]
MDLVKPFKRFSVCQLSPPGEGGRRLVLIVSPDEMNRHLLTLLVSPMTTWRRGWPTRVPVHFAGKDGEIALERIYTIDQEEIDSVLGKIPAQTAKQVSKTLVEMFAI